jgi:alpha-beta hydrolase superfamily lysophospholipase
VPIYIFNGDRDPVSDNIEQLIDAYRAAGLMQVVHKTYALGRHESLNEANRDVVTRELIAWLDGVIDRGWLIPSAVTG